MDAFKTAGEHDPHAQPPRSLRGPAAGAAASVPVTGDDHERDAAGAVVLRGSLHGHQLPGRLVPGDGPLLPGGEGVAQPGTAEGRGSSFERPRFKPGQRLLQICSTYRTVTENEATID